MCNASCCWLAIVLASASASGSNVSAPTFEERLLADATDGTLDEFDFVSACLIAGGVSDSRELADARRQYDELRQRIDMAAILALPIKDRATELHARLHSDVLVGKYQAHASDLRLALRSGDFNCLSAAAIYWDLSREAQLELEIWSRPGHVWLVEPASALAVEPGALAWNAGNQAPDTGRLTPPARRITPLQLIARFYYNRGLLLLQENRHAAGVELIRTSLVLDPQDREAHANLLAGLNNWAVVLCKQERFAEASRLIEQGLAIDACYAPLVANAQYVRGWLEP